MAEQQYAAAAPAPAGATASFFNPWEPPPTQAPPPSDPQLAERISLLIKHSVANGPAFLETVKTRQGNDPNFSFLYPHGEHHAYFRWALYCTCIAQPAAQPTQPQQFHAPPPHAAYPHGAAPPSAPPTHTPQPQQPAQAPAPVQPPVSSTALSPEVEAGFQQVLEALTGSKVGTRAHCACMCVHSCTRRACCHAASTPGTPAPHTSCKHYQCMQCIQAGMSVQLGPTCHRSISADIQRH